MPQDRQKLVESYDRIATQYACKFCNELDDKPLEQLLLTRFAARVRSHGRVCDLGCGPGHIARFLLGCGVDVFGLDVSSAMVSEALLNNPAIEFQVGDMAALDHPPDSLAGVVAFYSLIHIQPDEIAHVLGDLFKVLKPRGLLLMSLHLGSGLLHLDEMWGMPVDVDIVFYERSHVEKCLREAGFDVEDVIERNPYPEIEYQSRRAYFFARKP